MSDDAKGTVRIFDSGAAPDEDASAVSPSPPPRVLDDAPAKLVDAPPATSPGLEDPAILPLSFPAWPEGLVPPRKGKAVWGLRIRGVLTEDRDAPDRLIILWGLSVGDERVADTRAMMQSNPDLAMTNERAKQMIRSIDSMVVTWQRADVMDRFWDDIGPKYRNVIKLLYQRMHSLDDAERADFFGRCVAHRVAG